MLCNNQVITETLSELTFTTKNQYFHKLISTNRLALSSLVDSNGFAIGQVISKSVTPQNTTLVARIIIISAFILKSAVADKTTKPWANPGGTQNCFLLSADKITPSHSPNVDDPIRISTATS